MHKILLPLLSLALLTGTIHAQSSAAKSLLDMANQSRAEHNLPPLAWDPALAKAASAHLGVVIQHPGHRSTSIPENLTS